MVRYKIVEDAKAALCEKRMSKKPFSAGIIIAMALKMHGLAS